MKNKKFWNWARDDNSGVRTLYLDGVIAEESWFDDDVTPNRTRDTRSSKSGCKHCGGYRRTPF